MNNTAVRNLRRFIVESLSQLREEKNDDDDDEAVEPDESPGDSIDAQVDRYLSQYLEEAKGGAKKNESRARSSLLRLVEADDDEPELPGDVDDDSGEDSDGSADKFDVESYAGAVARLVQNFESLVDIEKAIVRRAEGFLREYVDDDDRVQQFNDALEKQYDVDDDDSDAEYDLGLPTPPAAAGAGSSPGG